MIWYKYTTPSEEYYSPFSKSSSRIESFESPKDMADSLNARDDAYQVITNNVAEIYNKEIPLSEPQDLEAGVYCHEHYNGGPPERLIPMISREDKYIDILDSLESLEVSVKDFVDNRPLYEESCSLYKLGILLYGPPGTGKTTWIREFIRKKKDAIVIYMDSVPSRSFLEKLETSTKNTLKILVFEEAVSLLEDSEDIREMLDFLDGSKSISNAVYLISTNYPESIPENIIRNGRIDTFVRVEYPTANARRNLINLYLKRNAIDEEVLLTENMPIVDIREICFMHRKTNKSFNECVKLIEEKNKLLKKHFGKAREIRL